MIQLSAAQSAVVQSPIGNAQQVLASAGSGKTRVLTERIRHIVSRGKKDCVIAITFTNKAADEMRERLEDLEDVENRCWITTIHSVAQRIVEQYGHTIGLPAELHIYEREPDRRVVFLQALRDIGEDVDASLAETDPQLKKENEKRIQRYLDQFSVVKRELLSEKEATQRFAEDENFWEVYEGYQAGLLQGGGLDFDDLLVYAHRIFLQQPWCADVYRAKYKHVCVDEAQDLNRAQYEFLKALCGDVIKSVMMVGDPHQMIFGFNGSSNEFLVESFVRDFKPVRYVLKENYRSSQAVIGLANKLKPGSQISLEYALHGKAVIKSFPSEEDEAQWICDQVWALLEMGSHKEIEGPITLGSMVVLARNRFAFTVLQEKLKECEIPFALKKGEKKAEPLSVFGKVLDLGVRLKLNPKDWVDGRKLCETLKIQLPASWGDDGLFTALATKARKAKIPMADIQASLLEAINKLNIDEPNIPKFCADFNTVLEQQKDFENDEEELEKSILELREFRRCWTIFRGKGQGTSLAAFRNASALGLLSDGFVENGLTLSTVHTMKGLEKDIVFLMGMCEGVFPDYREVSSKGLEGELNNAFVAVTRSRRWIYVTYPQMRKMPWGDQKAQRPSRFITLMSS